MKRTDITDIWPDAPKEAIDKIMSINGSDINAAKAELETVRQQLTEAMASKEKKDLDELKQAQQQISSLTKELDGMKAAEQLRTMREKVAVEKKIPAHLLTGDTEEICVQQAEQILEFAKPNSYPTLPDGGEIHDPPSMSTREKFASCAQENL